MGGCRYANGVTSKPSKLNVGSQETGSVRAAFVNPFFMKLLPYTQRSDGISAWYQTMLSGASSSLKASIDSTSRVWGENRRAIF